MQISLQLFVVLDCVYCVIMEKEATNLSFLAVPFSSRSKVCFTEGALGIGILINR